MKKTSITLTAVILTFGMVCANAQNISVNLNGAPIAFDQPPIIQDGRTLVPLRAIFEAMGADVAWDSNTQTVTASRGTDVITLSIGSNTLYKNNEAVTLDVPAQIMNDRTLVPARAVAESFGATVEWDGNTQTVMITDFYGTDGFIVIDNTQTEVQPTDAPETVTAPVSAPTAEPVNVTENAQYVWVGDTGTKYHKEDCPTLKGSGHRITMDQALSEGREACKVCYK